MKDFKIFGAYVGPFWWYEVEAWMHRPAEDNPGLAAIAKRVPSWEQ